MFRLEMNKKQEAILAAIILVAAFAVFFMYSGIGRAQDKPEESVEEPAPVPVYTSDIVAEHIEIYADIDDYLLTELERGGYSFSNPLVAINPYGSSPLTALVLFYSNEPVNITVTVSAKDEGVAVSHTFAWLDTTNIIPVYGLYPETVNLVTLGNGSEETVLLMETGPMPDWYPGQMPEDANAVPAEQIFRFTHTRVCAFDMYGQYRWYYSGFGSAYPVRYSQSGNLLLIIGDVSLNDAFLLEINLLGRIIYAQPVEDISDFERMGAHQLTFMPLY